MKARSALATALATALLLGGCSVGSSTRIEPDLAQAIAGADLVLRMGTDDFPGRPAADQIERFARQVTALSEGRIAIEPVWQAVGTEGYRPDWDQQVARLVASGELDLGLVPARAWDTEGVETLRPLQAPFLVDSHELLAAVVTSDLAPQMMTGLDEAGVVGLAIFPEGLRHPFAVEDPLLGPEDYQGQTLRVPTSATARALFDAWGATTDDEPLDRARHAGIESAFVLDPGGTATSNVTFYPKANVLVAGAELFEGLDEDARDVLARAADATLAWAVESFPAEAALADEFCDAGGVVVHADDDQLRALQEAATPVVADIRASAGNAAVLDAIEGMKAELSTSGRAPAPPPPPCGEQTETEQTGAEAELTGVYRLEVTEELMLRAWPDTPQSQLQQNVGTWTVSLNDGDAYLHGLDFTDVFETGTYRVEGDRVMFLFGDSTTPEVLQWTQEDDGSLTFEVVNVPEQFLFVYAERWQQVPGLEPWDG